MSGNITPTSIVVTTGPSQNIVPTGNPVATLTSLGVKATTQSSTKREYLVTVSFTTNKGTGVGTPNGDKVALYTDTVMESGTGDGWAFNPLLSMTSGSGNYSAQIIECDLNNSNAHRGDGAGANGLAPPVAYGISLSGAGSFRSTSGIIVEGPGQPIWNRGIVFGANSISQATYQDLTNSTTSIDIEGSHTYGIDFSNGTFSSVMKMGNGQTIAWLNAAGSALEAEIQFNNGNNLVLDLAGVGGVFFGSSILPINDNSYQCGQNTNRWSSVWAVNGVIQTSDPRLKIDITPVPSMLNVVATVNPVTFKWKSGGFEAILQDQEIEVQATRLEEWTEQVIEMKNGKPTLVEVKRSRDVPLFDEIEILDESGSHAFYQAGARPEVTDNAGTVVRESDPGIPTPRTHRVPRMKKNVIKRKVLAEHAGRRTHWGFLAPEVKSAFDKVGLDFGGYVQAGDGTECLRPDQMIAPLWKAVQELMFKVETLESKLESLSK